MIPEWAQYVMALSPVAVVVGLMLYLYFRGFRFHDRSREASSLEALDAARERGRSVRARRQNE
jgi:hypothetical protein